jgi:hypothetical protein
MDGKSFYYTINVPECRQTICSPSLGHCSRAGEHPKSNLVRHLCLFTAIAHSIFPQVGPLELDPSCSVLHYAQTIFEGLKAYKNSAGRVTLFRPDMNMKRMNTSAARIALPVCQVRSSA